MSSAELATEIAKSSVYAWLVVGHLRACFNTYAIGKVK